jgi:hypothetical protein
LSKYIFFAFILLPFFIYAQTFEHPVVFVGDTQRNSILEFFRENNEGIPAKICDKIAQENPCCVVHNGDMVFWGASKSRWKEFDSDAAPIIKKNIPIYPVLGNHEYMGRNATALNNTYIRFPFLKSSTWYCKIIDSTAIIFLNSNDGDLTKEQAINQLTWYKSTISALEKNTAVTYIITVCHHPPFTNSTLVGRSSYILKNFVPVFVKSAKTIAFFSGHCHSYEHFVYKGKSFIVSGGGGGPRQNVEPGHNGNDMPTDLYSGSNFRMFNYCKYFIQNGKPFIQVIGMSKETGAFQTMDEINVR